MPAPPELRFLLDAMPTALALVGRDLRYRFVSAAYARLYRVDAGDLEGAAVREVLGRDRWSVVRPLLEAALAGESREAEVVFDDHGERTVFAVSYVPRLVEGSPDGAFVFATDVTQTRRMEEAVRDSERRFRATFEHAAIGLGIVSLEGRWLRVNEELARLTGYTQDELVRRTFQDITHPDDLDTDLENVQRLVAGEIATYAMEKRYLRKDGGAVWVDLTVGLVRDEDGRPAFFISAVRDATERKRAEDAIRESERRFRAMADSAPAMVWVTEADGGCTFLSRKWLEFTGQDLESGLGFGWLDAVHPDDRGAVRDAFLRSNEAASAFRVEYRLRRADGVWRWAIDAAAPRFDDAGAFRGYVGSVIDITERREAEEALREADRRKDEFLAILGHEIRNPLAVLTNGIQVLRLPSVSPDDRRAVEEAMERQLGHLRGLVDDLLDVTRIARGKIRLQRRPVPVDEIARAAVTAARPLLDARGHELHVDTPPDLLVDADPTRLEQILVNLLTNAAKYTPPGGHLSLTTTSTPDTVSLHVQDDGIGLSPHDLRRVFEPFSQVREDNPAGGGLGIGLTLVRQLVALHGGRVRAESDGRGKGSRFVVELPRVGG